MPYNTDNAFFAVSMPYIQCGLARCTLTLNLNLAHLNVSYLLDAPYSARPSYSWRSLPRCAKSICPSCKLYLSPIQKCRTSNSLYFVPQCALPVSLCSDRQLLYLNSHEPHSVASNGSIYQPTQGRNIEL